MNRPASENSLHIKAVHTDMSIDVTSPTIEETRMNIEQMNSGKAAESDNIPVEALKSDIEATESMFHVLFMKILEEEQVPPTD